MQREFFRDYSLSASYVGALGRKLPASVDQQLPRLRAGGDDGATSTRAGRTSPASSAPARVLESIFGSDYHGLQLAAEKRGAHFSAKAYYTFSKALEDVDYQGGGLPAVQNSNRLELERGRTSNDRTHVFVLSGVWRIDYVQEGSSLVRALLNDWTLSGIVTAAERPAAHDHARGWTATSTASTTDRADIVGDPELDSGRPREELIEGWFNTAAFALPAVGTDGTAGRNIIDGPGFRNVDLGLFRTSASAGAFMLQLRAEATNVFNIVNLLEPGHRPQRARDLRQDPHRRRHAADPAGRAAVVLIPRGCGGRGCPPAPSIARLARPRSRRRPAPQTRAGCASPRGRGTGAAAPRRAAPGTAASPPRR